MVETQLVTRGIRDPRVLDAMRTVPRHRFVPRAVADAACEDRPLPIGECQTISQPYMVAIMTQLIGAESHHRVLEIGTGKKAPRTTAFLVTAGAPSVPAPLLPQLAESGRLVIPVGPSHIQQLMVIDRRGSAFDTHTAGGCIFVPLIGRHGWLSLSECHYFDTMRGFVYSTDGLVSRAV